LHRADDDKVFLAAGTGIAPIRSMIHSVLREPGRSNARLLFGARNKESLLFHSEFLARERKHPRFRYLPVLSRPADSGMARAAMFRTTSPAYRRDREQHTFAVRSRWSRA
jgi:ferredoxin-NADP reductase